MASADGEDLPFAGAEAAPTVFLGRIFGPDGAPAAGAVVVSSVGGQAVTDTDGNYRLEVEVPFDAESVRVTAVARAGGGILTASARIALTGAFVTPAEILFLQPGGGCQPSWVPTFGEQPGVGTSVLALTVFDDGSGPELYVGGSFTSAGSVAANRIAKWDGASWSAVGSGMNSDVYALAVFDDGSGAALYAGGYFTTAGGVAAKRIARWDGSSWSALGSGMDSSVVSAEVRALTVFDDGSGPALYAGGTFATAGGGSASHIAKWDGAGWSALASGVGGAGGSVNALTVFDDGSGPVLCVGGSFTLAGGAPAARIARWNGSSWTSLGSGMSSTVWALTGFDDGSGAELYAGGQFISAGGRVAHGIAKWGGANWSALGSGVNTAFALEVFDDGSGAALYVGGSFTLAGGAPANQIAKWDGSSWAPLGGGMPHPVHALAAFDDGSGPALHAGGLFLAAQGAVGNRIAKWDGSSWSSLGSGMDGFVHALTVFDDGSGQALYAGGRFVLAGGVTVNRIAEWNGSSWSAVGSGMNSDVRALTVFDDGSGAALYAGGSFSVAGGVAASRVARWDGSSWSALGSGMDDQVSSLAVFDDGGGPALYAGGSFAEAGGVTAYGIAQWDGSTWAPVRTGLFGAVSALAVFDDGNGAALYAGGSFELTGGGVTVNYVAQWDGTRWSSLEDGLNSSVRALAVFDDGSGPALYAGGDFTAAVGGVPASFLAKWDGSSWSALGSGTNGQVSTLSVFDDGSGPALYAGGGYSSAGEVPANRIAQWDGSNWSALGNGMSSGAVEPSSVRALTVFDDGGGAALFAGGEFTGALDSRDSFLAKWRGIETTPPTISCPSALLVADDRTSPPGEIVNFLVTASDECDLEPTVVCVPPSGSFFPRGTTIVTCTATDATGNGAVRTFPVSVALPPRRC